MHEHIFDWHLSTNYRNLQLSVLEDTESSISESGFLTAAQTVKLSDWIYQDAKCPETFEAFLRSKLQETHSTTIKLWHELVTPRSSNCFPLWQTFYVLQTHEDGKERIKKKPKNKNSRSKKVYQDLELSHYCIWHTFCWLRMKIQIS